MKRNKQELYDKMGLSKKDVRLLNDYFDAFSNFYGRLPLRAAFEIINEQNDGRFNEALLLKFTESKKREERFYYIINPSDFFEDREDLDELDWEIVHESLLSVDEEEYYDLCDAQEGKPICVLPKQELLKYADDFYKEETAENKDLEKFLEENVEILQPPASSGCINTAKDLVDEYILGLKIETDLTRIGIEDLLRLAILPEDEEKYNRLMDELLPLAIDVRNSTRIWANRGYTSTELAMLIGGFGTSC